MKRLIISLALALSVLAASVFEVVYVSGKSDDYAKRINNIDHLISVGNSDKALAECKKLEADWESGSRKTYTLLSHDAVDSIGFCVSRMSAFLTKGSYQMSNVLCREHERKKRTRLHKRKRVPVD